MEPTTVASIAAVAVIAVVAIVRSSMNKSKADELVKYAQVAAQTAHLFVQAAEQAVTDVESDLKKFGGLQPAELKQAAAEKAAEILKAWGVFVTPQMMDALLSIVEDAYQRMKANKTQFHTEIA
jgi:hypothetical protein